MFLFGYPLGGAHRGVAADIAEPQGERGQIDQQHVLNNLQRLPVPQKPP